MGSNPSKIKARLEGAPVVVIVGGGYGGVALAKALDADCNVVLIDRKDYFFHNMGALRACVTPSYAWNICIPYVNLLKFGHVVKGEVTRVSQGGVYLHGRDEPLDFDYLVIATGTSYAFPAKIAASEYMETPPLYTDMAGVISAARRIAIVGGGPTGCELAGEIHEVFPDEELTLVHSRESLIGEPFRDAFSAAILEKLERSCGTTVILGDRVELEASQLATTRTVQSNYVVGERVLRTRNGREIACDLVFFCTGARVNRASYENDFADAMEPSGRLRVNEHLQVEGFSNIFVLGDCNNVVEPKMAYAAQQQAAVLAKNIVALHAGKALKSYVPSDPVMIVTLGSEGGVSQLPVAGGKIMGSLFSRTVKAKGLFTANQWSTMRLKMPRDGPADLAHAEPAEDDVPRLAQAMQVSEAEAQQLLDGLPASEREGADYT